MRKHGTLLCDRPGHRFKPLFERRCPGVEAIAVAIQGVDSGGQASDVVAAFPRDALNLFGLPCQICGGHAILPVVDVGSIGQSGDCDGKNRADAPETEPPAGPPIVSVLIRQEADVHVLQVVGDHVVSQVFAAFCHQILSAPPTPPNHTRNNIKNTSRPHGSWEWSRAPGFDL